VLGRLVTCVLVFQGDGGHDDAQLCRHARLPVTVTMATPQHPGQHSHSLFLPSFDMVTMAMLQLPWQCCSYHGNAAVKLAFKPEPHPPPGWSGHHGKPDLHRPWQQLYDSSTETTTTPANMITKWYWFVVTRRHGNVTSVLPPALQGCWDDLWHYGSMLEWHVQLHSLLCYCWK